MGCAYCRWQNQSRSAQALRSSEVCKPQMLDAEPRIRLHSWMLILLCSSCRWDLVLPSENRNAWKVVFNLQKPTVKRFGALQEIWDIYRTKSKETMETVKLCHALYCVVNMRSLGWTRKIMIIFLTLGTAGPHTCWASTTPLTDTPTLHTAPLTDTLPPQHCTLNDTPPLQTCHFYFQKKKCFVLFPDRVSM